MRFAVVVSRDNLNITQGLLDGALETFRKNKIAAPKIVWVPGAFEIPLAVQGLAQRKKYDAVLALGCILKGETSHNHYIAESMVHALMRIGLEQKIPVAFGVLTPNTLSQARSRSSKGSANKGMEAAEAAIEMAELFKRIQHR